MTSNRNHQLDGLRGYAALCVVASHVAGMAWTPFEDGGTPSAWQYALWHLGAPAVDLFFVLSGYVVARSLLTRPRLYRDYALARAVRLLPVAWLAVCAGLALRALHLLPPPGATAGLSHLSQTLSAGDVVGFATMVAPIPETSAVNPPLWSLVAEMQASLLIPLLLWAATRRPALTAGCGLAVLVVLALALNHEYPIVFAGFVVGVALAAAADRIPPVPRPAALLVASAILLLSRHMLATDEVLMRIPCALGAAGVLVAVRSGALRRLLSGRMSQHLGRISYPLYALHWPVMAASVMTLGHAVGVVPAAIAGVPAAIAVAVAVERLVDRPSTAISSLLGRRTV